MHTICIVIPCYNEANRLPVDFLVDFYSQSGSEKVNFCLVNDGSKDKTIELLNSIKQQFPNSVNVMNLQQNVGKAEAVRSGINEVLNKGYEWIGYFDADMATPLSEIFHFDKAITGKNYTFVCGSRMKRMGATVERDTLRHYIGRVFATLASMALQLPIYDTQCGAKLIHSSVAKELFAEKFMTRWLFDVEIFARIIHAKGRPYVLDHTLELPLNEWYEIGGSKVNWSHAFLVPLQLFKIRRKYKL